MCCFSILKVLEHEVNVIFFDEIITIITIHVQRSFETFDKTWQFYHDKSLYT